MKIIKFNEAKSSLPASIVSKLPSAAKKLYLKTIFPELVNDTKEFLDLYFVDLLDDSCIEVSTMVDSIYLKMNYIIKYTADYNDFNVNVIDITKKKPLSKYADMYENIAENLRYIENRLEQLEEEYKDRSIYGDDEIFSVTKFKKKFSVHDGGFVFILIME